MQAIPITQLAAVLSGTGRQTPQVPAGPRHDPKPAGTDILERRPPQEPPASSDDTAPPRQAEAVATRQTPKRQTDKGASRTSWRRVVAKELRKARQQACNGPVAVPAAVAGNPRMGRAAGRPLHPARRAKNGATVAPFQVIRGVGPMTKAAHGRPSAAKPTAPVVKAAAGGMGLVLRSGALLRRVVSALSA